MKVTLGMIDRQYRICGFFTRTFLRYRNEKHLKIMASLSQKALGNKTSKKLHCEERFIPRDDGTKLRLCIYSAKQRQEYPVPCFLWIHGGGYAMGSATMAIPYAESLISARECVVVAPDYTTSNKKPYPAAMEDCYTSLLWLKDHAKDLNIRTDQIFIGGDSAGGGLTAALSLYARDKGEIRIAFQIPLYPMIDDRMRSASIKDNNAPFWNERANRIAWKLYLGDLYGSNEIPAYAAPARETDYSNLPQTFSFVGSLDPFRDETVQYIENLRAAGVNAELYEYEGCYHAFDQANAKADKSRDAITKMVEAYKKAADSCFVTQ